MMCSGTSSVISVPIPLCVHAMVYMVHLHAITHALLEIGELRFFRINLVLIFLSQNVSEFFISACPLCRECFDTSVDEAFAYLGLCQLSRQLGQPIIFEELHLM
jgi:hypothetical protein